LDSLYPDSPSIDEAQSLTWCGAYLNFIVNYVQQGQVIQQDSKAPAGQVLCIRGVGRRLKLQGHQTKQRACATSGAAFAKLAIPQVMAGNASKNHVHQTAF
jgi:hypothetical protein